METEQPNPITEAEAQAPVTELKQKSQRDLVFELITAVLNGRDRGEGTHMKDHMTKEEKKQVRLAIVEMIKSGIMAYKKDISNEAKVKKYASCLLCDAFKKDSRYS